MIVTCPTCNTKHNTHCNVATICYCGFFFRSKAKVIGKLEKGITIELTSEDVGYQGLRTITNITNETVMYNGRKHRVYLNTVTNELFI